MQSAMTSISAQVLALIRAARDPDDEVRNNATRALGVLVRSARALPLLFAPDHFHRYARSRQVERPEQSWTSLLMELTASGGIQTYLGRYVRWPWIH